LVQELNIERPNVVKIIPIETDSKDVHTNILLKDVETQHNPNDIDVTLEGNILPDISSQKNTQEQNHVLNNVKESSKQSESELNKVTFGEGEIKEIKGVGFEPVTADSDDKSSSPHSIKIVTYDQTPEAPTLETDNLLNSETSGNNENLQNLVPNHLPAYTQLNGGAVSGEKCDEFSCLNDGKCVDDGTVYRNKVRCDCKLGTIGSKCEKGKCLNNENSAIESLTLNLLNLEVIVSLCHQFRVNFGPAVPNSKLGKSIT
jgi:hypothetical protein